MHNANTVARCVTLPGAAQGATSTAEFQFLGADAAQANALVSPVPASNFRTFVVRAGGRVTSGAAGNFTGKIYLGKSTTIVSNVALTTTGAIAWGTSSGSWFTEAIVSVDITGLKFNGVFYGAALGTAVAQAALSATGAPNPTAEMAFTVTGQFSVSNASNAAYLDYLSVEEL